MGQLRDRMIPNQKKSLSSLAEDKRQSREPPMNTTKNFLQKSCQSHSSILAAVMSAMTVASFCVLPAIASPLAGTWGYITKSRAAIHIRPSSASPNVAKVSRRTKVMAWGTFNGWYRVETTDNHYGWVHHDFLKVQSPSKLKELSHTKAKNASNRTDDTQMLYGSPLQLRLYYAKYKAEGALQGLQKMGVPLVASAHVKSTKLAQNDSNKSQATSQSAQELLASLDVNNNYSVKNIDPVKKASRGGSPRDVVQWAKHTGRLAMGERIADKALSYRGMPYIFGAESPSSGFDCSGLVSYVLHQKGLNPPRTSSAQAHYGTKVSRSNLKPGDLVFFAGTYKRGVSHVGIYIGNNNFVHAANPSKGVRVDSLSSSYYANHYHSARRPPYKK